MKFFITIIFILNAIIAQTGENQSFKLKDGTMIDGTVIEENDDTYTIQTKYGSVTVNKNELVQKKYEINSLKFFFTRKFFNKKVENFLDQKLGKK